MNLRSRILALSLGLSLSSLSCAADQFAISPTQLQALGVSLRTLAPSTTTLSVAYPAKVILMPDQERVVSSALSAMVSRVLVQEGAAVKPGQPLLELQSPELAGLQLTLIQAAGKARLAASGLTREKTLFTEGITPQRRLLEAEAADQEAQAALTQARAALNIAGMSSAAISRIEKSGKPETALVLTAPAAGMVTSLVARPGQQVTVADALLHLVQTTPVWVEIQLPVAAAGRYRPGLALQVGKPGVPARLMSLSPVAGNTQSLSARARLTGQPGQPLLPGMAVEAYLPTEGGGAWLLPQTAVTRQGSQAYVFVRTKAGFEARAVTVGAASGQLVRVEGKLASGEQIATSNVVALKGVWLGESGMGED